MCEASIKLQWRFVLIFCRNKSSVSSNVKLIHCRHRLKCPSAFPFPYLNAVCKIMDTQIARTSSPEFFRPSQNLHKHGVTSQSRRRRSEIFTTVRPSDLMQLIKSLLRLYCGVLQLRWMGLAMEGGPFSVSAIVIQSSHTTGHMWNYSA